jgi:hypothetical protein
MTSDLATIGATVAAVADPASAIKIAARLPFFRFPVCASGSLSGGVVAIAPLALAVAGGADPPRFDKSEHAILHMGTSLFKGRGGA